MLNKISQALFKITHTKLNLQELVKRARMLFQAVSWVLSYHMHLKGMSSWTSSATKLASCSSTNHMFRLNVIYHPLFVSSRIVTTLTLPRTSSPYLSVQIFHGPENLNTY